MFLKSKNSADLSDQDLISQFKKGNDPEVLGQLYSKYVALVYGLCLKYLEDREWSKDATMQIFELLATELYRHEIISFKGWMYVFCKNYCLMELRKQKSLRKKEEIWLIQQKDFMETPDDLHPIDGDENPELNEALKNCIEKMKEDQQQCVRMFYFERKSYRQITAEIGFDEKKVKSLLQNGKRNLKICLDNQHVR
ncbi:MAG: sigma-70 family RNA polymerase sigma factor [Bacteroidia bacterium]|nr:sigma-70 family RNA polymerase sigma factor [Bacteroidia bacterium]